MKKLFNNGVTITTTKLDCFSQCSGKVVVSGQKSRQEHNLSQHVERRRCKWNFDRRESGPVFHHYPTSLIITVIIVIVIVILITTTIMIWERALPCPACDSSCQGLRQNYGLATGFAALSYAPSIYRRYILNIFQYLSMSFLWHPHSLVCHTRLQHCQYLSIGNHFHLCGIRAFKIFQCETLNCREVLFGVTIRSSSFQ